MELTAIPGVEDPWKFAQKIWASFLIPEVRSRVFLGQGYTAPPALKCLAWNMFLPDELSYQDVRQQPFLLTVAYAWGLQYWAEILNPPVDPDFHPLVRSVLELREMVKEHVVFSKKDITWALGRINLRNTSQWPQTIPTNIRSGDSSYAGAQEACVTTPPSYGFIPERRHTTVLQTRPWMEDQPIGQDASFIEAATPAASSTASGVNMTSPITLPNQTEGER